LDRRVLTAPYGAGILDAIAGNVVRCGTAEDVATAVAGVFDEVG
jgi:hypothetical protein